MRPHHSTSVNRIPVPVEDRKLNPAVIGDKASAPDDVSYIKDSAVFQLWETILCPGRTPHPFNASAKDLLSCASGPRDSVRRVKEMVTHLSPDRVGHVYH